MTTFRLNPPTSYVEDGRPWYDTKDGIRTAVKTLNGFLRLRSERNFAGYERKENLNQIYVFGDYSFDTCGNCSIAQPSVKKYFPTIPDVLTHEEFWAFIKENSKDGNTFGISFAHGISVPSETVLCPMCQIGWSIENMHNVVTRDSHMDFYLGTFHGRKLSEVIKYYAARTDAKYRIGTEPFLHNKRFIDLSPWTLNPQTEFEKKMVKNDNGWVGTKDGINADYIICEGDKMTLSVTHFFHSECNRKDLSDKQQGSFEKYFKAAGFAKISLEAIPNEYCNCEYCAPWFIVSTEIGKFKIGWRKSVINIDWENLNIKYKNKSIPDLFKEEDVTQGANHIHAHGNEATVEYLTRILNLCKNKR